MKLRFWIDPETGLPHIYDHGVTEQEVRQVLSRPGLNFPGGRGSRIVMGQTSGGRHLKRLSGFRMAKPGVLWLDTALHQVPKRFLIFEVAELRVFLGSRDFSEFDVNVINGGLRRAAALQGKPDSLQREWEPGITT